MTASAGAAIMRQSSENAMTTATTAPPLPDVPADVLDFARKQKADGYVGPVLTLARSVFPEAPLRIYLEADPDLEDEWRIILDVALAGWSVEQGVDAYDRFTDAFLHSFPLSIVGGVFCLRMRSGG